MVITLLYLKDNEDKIRGIQKRDRNKRRDYMRKYAVITGASAGIGMEFAKILAQRGYALILVARRKERLQKLTATLNTACEIITADLEKEEACYDLIKHLQDKKIEIFINNAGFGDCGLFLDTDLEKEINMVQLNIKAVHILTKLMLRKMQEENAGYILNVASSAGLIPAGPFMSTYYATKAYVASLTRGVAEELRQSGSNVYVGCLCPGPVATEFNSVANVEFALKGISPQYCAKYALEQMAKRKVVIIPTLQMKMAMTFGRFLPSTLYVRIAAHQQKKKMGN